MIMIENKYCEEKLSDGQINISLFEYNKFFEKFPSKDRSQFIILENSELE